MKQRRVAAVTGGLSGIGSGITVALTARGFDLVRSDRVIDGPKAPRLGKRVAPDARLGGAFGGIDCLANKAGVAAMARGDLLEVLAESCDVNFAVNARAGFYLTQVLDRWCSFPHQTRIS